MSNDQWEGLMTDSLESRVRDLREAPLTFEAVAGKARRIRTRRRVAVAGAVLATAAVVTPVALSLGSGGDTGVQPAVTPTVVDSSTPDPVPDDDPLGVGYVEGDTFHPAEGGEVDLGRDDYTDAVQLREGVVLAYRTGGNGQGFVDVVTGDQVSLSNQVSGPWASTGAGSVAFVSEGEVEVWTADGQTSYEGMPVGDDARVLAVSGSPGCQAGECRIYLDPGTGAAPYLLQEGSEPLPGDVLNVSDVRGGLYLAQTDSTDTGSCWAVYPEGGRGGDAVLRTCDHSLVALSPDGEHVVATDAYGDGLGPSSFSILDLDGREVARYAPESGFVNRMVWDGSGAVVATVFDGGQWQVVRLGVDGTTETVLDDGAGDDTTPTWFLTD